MERVVRLMLALPQTGMYAVGSLGSIVVWALLYWRLPNGGLARRTLLPLAGVMASVLWVALILDLYDRFGWWLLWAALGGAAGTISLYLVSRRCTGWVKTVIQATAVGCAVCLAIPLVLLLLQGFFEYGELVTVDGEDGGRRQRKKRRQLRR